MYYSNLDKIFDSFFNGNNSVNYRTYRVVPTPDSNDNQEYELNIVKDGAYLHFEVPGFNKENLEVLIEGSELVIEGTRKYKINNEERTKSINQRIDLNKLYDPTTVEATVVDGLLTVYIPSFEKETTKKKNRISLM